jgi:hypothetical protein
MANYCRAVTKSLRGTRAYWRWNHKYESMLPKHAGLAPFVQFIVGWSALFYCINYSNISHHRNQKYHWQTESCPSSSPPAGEQDSGDLSEVCFLERRTVTC